MSKDMWFTQFEQLWDEREDRQGKETDEELANRAMAKVKEIIADKIDQAMDNRD